MRNPVLYTRPTSMREAFAAAVSASTRSGSLYDRVLTSLEKRTGLIRERKGWSVTRRGSKRRRH